MTDPLSQSLQHEKAIRRAEQIDPPEQDCAEDCPSRVRGWAFCTCDQRRFEQEAAHADDCRKEEREGRE